MEHKSIYEQFNAFASNLLSREIGDNLGDFIGNAVSEFKQILNDIVAIRMEELDKLIFDSNEIKKRYVARGIREKTIACESGFVTYKRHYFTERDTGKGSFLADACVGVAKGSRVESGFALKIVKAASQYSYGNVSKQYNGIISRQTVSNKVHEVINVPDVVRKKNYDVRQIHIEADEDHVSTHAGPNAMVRLAVIHEGRKWHSDGRCSLINKYVLVSLNEPLNRFWERVSEKVDELYGVRCLMVNIHGDGAMWIKSGLAYFDDVRFILDKYHLFRRIRSVAGDRNEAYYSLLRCIGQDDFSGFRRVLSSIKPRNQNEKSIEDCYAYLTNNWYGAVNALSGAEYSRSCAEGLVSNILSNRLSSRPMPWGSNLSIMSTLLAYFQNGGKLSIENINPLYNNGYNIYKQIDKGNVRGLPL